MKKSAEMCLMPYEAEDVTRMLGAKIRTARRARQWSQADLSQYSEISVNTIVKMEGGGLSIQFGFYLKVLWALNLIDGFSKLIEPLGLDAGEVALLDSALPKRIHGGKS